MKKIFTFFVAAMCCVTLLAETQAYISVTVDGIKYLIDNGTNPKQATVLNSDEGFEEVESEYSGDIVLPETIHYAETFIVNAIAQYAFNESKITSIELPAQLDQICYHAFYNCTQLTSITCLRGSKTQAPGVPVFVNPSLETIPASDVFSGVDPTIPVYVPDAVVNDYKTSPWGVFFTNILALSQKPTTGINQVSVNEKVTKQIVDGQLLIERNGQLFNAQGARVE